MNGCRYLCAEALTNGAPRVYEGVDNGSPRAPRCRSPHSYRWLR